MRDKPQHCYDSGCPLAEKGRGFVLGTGDPRTAKIAIILEAPGRDEIAFPLTMVPGRRFLSTQTEIDAEVARRKARYPDIDIHLIKRGAPIVGASGSMMNQWVLPAVGVKRENLFIDHVIRCQSPKVKNSEYPTGAERHEAERCCRHYDRLEEFNPGALVGTMLPKSLLVEITPLPLLLKDVEKARDFAQAGFRTILLMGGKAAKAFMRYGENIARWRGSYELTGPGWYTKTLEFFKGGVGKKKRESKRELFSGDLFDGLLTSRVKRVKQGERPQCTATVPKKGQCTRKSQEGSGYCGTHRKKYESPQAPETSNANTGEQ